ncbi:MAG: 3,4-dihydroxy-2-butanone-4-phosphate synthase, partial [Paludibacteraceae bacterium]|nr:3,4-dihydroxy-2-butanone-4-phosphate synthase [Paludibacteraceae bacterium]
MPFTCSASAACNSSITCQERSVEPSFTNNTSIHETPFTVTVDLLGHGCTTGVSMHDRAASINALADKTMKATDFGRPGHVNPLRARDGGVLVRAGHTEGTVDLLKLAGMEPVGALIEIINPDGTMARLPELLEVAEQYGITITSIEKLIAYRLEKETL